MRRIPSTRSNNSNHNVCTRERLEGGGEVSGRGGEVSGRGWGVRWVEGGVR